MTNVARYKIKYSGGLRSDEVATLAEAKEIIRGRFGAESFFYDNDVNNGGRMLAWKSEEDSEDDDGAKAVASIYAIEA